jgi:hypothetical protein
LFINKREHETELRAFTLREIPVELTHKIEIYRGVIENHTLRFVCKQLHQISHKYGSIQNEGNFFFVGSIQEKIPIFSIAAERGYLNILNWTR